MAEVILTAEAVLLAQKRLRGLAELGVLFVDRSGAQKDIVRAPDGTPKWLVEAEAEWKAWVGPIAERPGAAERKEVVQGVAVFAEPRAALARGSLLIAVVAEEFVVEYRAT